MGEIPAAGLIVVMLGSAFGVTLGQFLNRLFSKGDKTDTVTEDLKVRVAKLESNQETDKELQWYRMREHVGNEYATKPQIDALSKKVDDALGRIERMLIPVFKRMYPDTTLPE